MTPAPVEPVAAAAPPFRGPTMMTQDWKDAAFLHWAVDPAEVAPFLPPGVRPDVHEGVTYVGLIPFRMVGAGVSRGPSIPFFGTFLETNVRLYTVDGRGRRGIVFRSLDADRLAVVLGAQAAFGLPYRWARMSFRHADGELTYRATTIVGGHRSVVRIRPGAPVTDGLTTFLTARWGLHERHLGLGLYVPNVHEPWPLRTAELTAFDDELVAAAGFPQLAGRAPDLVHYSPGVSVRFGLPGGRPSPALPSPSPARGEPSHH
ncbi:YqjF family protein [Actinomycetospora sp. CA-084318]|uniref:YqjF family protein n=1 Tax=Actinomycetospora sp. CA-084318 TaxID=3239892 RepID=UPI003D97809D